jgi:hypothetical protein
MPDRSSAAIIAAFAVAISLAACAHAPATREPAMTTKDNRIDYVEFAAADLAAFKRFYGAAFGWSFQDWGPDYASFAGAGLDGGVRKGPPATGTTMVILYADDLAAAEKKVTAAGGEILERHEFPGGRRFHFRDATGNVLAVWTKAE